jgi:hypothetical protein
MEYSKPWEEDSKQREKEMCECSAKLNQEMNKNNQNTADIAKAVVKEMMQDKEFKKFLETIVKDSTSEIRRTVNGNWWKMRFG